MKNLLVYYFVSFGPFGLLIFAARSEMISAEWFCILLLLYASIYRTITDYYRLRSKGLIAEGDFWQLFRFGCRARYFRELYLP